MVVLEGERDDGPIGVFIRVIPRRSVFDGGGAGHVHLLHHLGLADVPGSVEAVHQLQTQRKTKVKYSGPLPLHP